nr:13681_t:CDS:2 [Entrophospora candida]
MEKDISSFMIKTITKEIETRNKTVEQYHNLTIFEPFVGAGEAYVDIMEANLNEILAKVNMKHGELD